jgi:hAT family C-terminal dimerisation region
LPAKPVVKQFRDVKDGNQGEKEYIQLMAIRQSYPASSAECERGFSRMSNITTNQKNCLKVERLSNLMFVNVNGPDIDPFPFVSLWLAAGDRQSISDKPGATSKTDQL